MNNFNHTSSSDDDWTVVADQDPSPATTAFDVIDHKSGGGVEESGGDTDETVLELREENRKITEEWHRLRIENEGMAREIKGARFLMSKMLETLGLEHDDVAYETVLSSNVWEDLKSFQNLTKKLLCAVTNGVVQKIDSVGIKKKDQEDGPKPVDIPKPTPRGVEKIPESSETMREEASITNRLEQVMISVTRLPRIEEREVTEVSHEMPLRIIRQMVKERSRKQRSSWKPGGLHHSPGISKKKRWASNRGAPRQAFTARRKC